MRTVGSSSVFNKTIFKAASLRAQLPLLTGPSREETWGHYRLWEAWMSGEEIRGPALTAITKKFQPTGVFKFTTPLPALISRGTWPPTPEPRSLLQFPAGYPDSKFSNPAEKTAEKTARSLPPRPDPPISAWGGMDSFSAFQAATEAPPHSRHFIGFGDRPPECQLRIGRVGRRSALFPGARGGRDHAPYVWTLGRLGSLSIAAQKEGRWLW